MTTADAALARKLRILRNHGQDPEVAPPEFVAPGLNLRLTEFQAALGTTQLAKLDRLLAHRREVAKWYDGALRGSGLRVQQAPEPEAHSWQAFVLLLPPEVAARRAEIIVALRARGVEAQIGTHHQPLTKWFKAQGGHRVGEFPVTDDVAARALSLPMHSRVTQDDVATVVAELRAVLAAEAA